MNRKEREQAKVFEQIKLGILTQTMATTKISTYTLQYIHLT